MNVEPEQLKQFLVDAGILSRQEIDETEERAREENINFADALVKSGYLSPDELRRAQSRILGIPFVDLKEESFDLHTLSFIPEPISRNHNIVAFSQPDDETLEVALLDTADTAHVAFIKKNTGKTVLPRLTDRASIQHALRTYQKMLKEEFGEVIRNECESLKTRTEREEGDTKKETEKEIKRVAEDASTVRLVDALLKHAIVQNASDIHIEPHENAVLIRYRIDGELYDAITLPRQAAESITARIKLLAYLTLDEDQFPQDGRFRVETDSESVSFRVSVIPTYYGERVVLRLLRESVGGFTLEGLGLHGDALERVHTAIREQNGLLLTAGPTASGRTTTLYTILDILNSPRVSIATIEDPIEYQMPRINQTQVRPDIGFTFAKGLRSIVRGDPDIIMAGEIRDAESTDIAVNAALTGRLVLSTLPAGSAAEAIAGLYESSADASQLAAAVNVVIGERLVRRLCNTREPYTPSEKEWEYIKEHADLDRVLAALKKENHISANAEWDDVQFYAPATSSECPDGYSGRIGIFEVLPVTPLVRTCIAEGADARDIEKQARDEGMLTLLEDGIFKAAQGITSLEEVFRVISGE